MLFFFRCARINNTDREMFGHATNSGHIQKNTENSKKTQNNARFVLDQSNLIIFSRYEYEPPRWMNGTRETIIYVTAPGQKF